MQPKTVVVLGCPLWTLTYDGTVTLKDRLRPAVLIGRRLRRREIGLVDLAWSRTVSFSQFGEDVFLLSYFGDEIGTYVDVGAFHPFHLSNTLLLHRHGWRGMNIEPDPDAFALFHAYRPRDVNLRYAISTGEGIVAFSRAGSFSGINDGSYLWRGMAADTIEVETRTLAAVVAEHGAEDSQFLCVDCEGHDLEVLRSNDWERFRPRVIAAEEHEGRSVAEFLGGVGYRRLVRLGPTSFFEGT